MCRLHISWLRREELVASYIAGKSVHSTRTERLWRDVLHCIISLYYSLFSHLEEIGILDIEEDLVLWALHYVFIPRSTAHLETFVSAYGNHPLSTENNRTPDQLWVEGLAATAGRTAGLAQDSFGTRNEVGSSLIVPSIKDQWMKLNVTYRPVIIVIITKTSVSLYSRHSTVALANLVSRVHHLQCHARYVSS